MALFKNRGFSATIVDVTQGCQTEYLARGFDFAD